MLHKFNRKRILTCSACKVSPSWSPLSVEYVADVPVVDCHCCHGKTSEYADGEEKALHSGFSEAVLDCCRNTPGAARDKVAARGQIGPK